MSHEKESSERKLSDPLQGEEAVQFDGAVCPVPLGPGETIVLGHGSGGKLMHDLIEAEFVSAFANPALLAGNDGAVVGFESGGDLVVSTDSHVVWPLFFPGGDMGRLAVCGSVNDVAMMGAQPMYLTASFILEEGLLRQDLQEVVRSMQTAALEAEVEIVAGDTKVVERGSADGLYITTTCMGYRAGDAAIAGDRARPGDIVMVSGYLGDHGIAVLAARGDLGFEAEILSDVAPLNHLIQSLLKKGQGIHVLRDPTRGGAATALNEIARQSGVGVVLRESAIPVRPAVQSACEMLGFDPLYVANEGKLILIADPAEAAVLLEHMRDYPYGREAAIIGEIVAEPEGRVLMETTIGSRRIVTELAGEMLPRIC